MSQKSSDAYTNTYTLDNATNIPRKLINRGCKYAAAASSKETAILILVGDIVNIHEVTAVNNYIKRSIANTIVPALIVTAAFLRGVITSFFYLFVILQKLS